jgi:Aspartate/tyrosine/aromatic aminotransferase
LTWV